MNSSEKRHAVNLTSVVSDDNQVYCKSHLVNSTISAISATPQMKLPSRDGTPHASTVDVKEDVQGSQAHEWCDGRYLKLFSISVSERGQYAVTRDRVLISDSGLQRSQTDNANISSLMMNRLLSD